MSHEVGGGSDSLRGPTISAGGLHEGGDMYSPRGQSMDGSVSSQLIGGHVGSQQGRSGSQQSQGGQDAS